MKKLPYGFREGKPNKIGDYLCFALIGTHSSEGKIPVRPPDTVSRGYWTHGMNGGSFMKEDGWIGWYGAICLMHHPISIKIKYPLTDDWENYFKSILKKMGYKKIV